MSTGVTSLEPESTQGDAPGSPNSSHSQVTIALETLAARCGIQSSGEDAFGHQQETGADLKRALLKAMRFRADTEQQATEALNALEASEWECALPPVAVVYTNADAIAVPVVLPAGTREVRWALRLEEGTQPQGTQPQGKQQEGVVEAQALPLIEQIQHHGRSLERRSLTLPDGLPLGYHKLSLHGLAGETTLIVTPGRCWLPSKADHAHMWGLAANLFLLRTEHNWGIGDFTDLRALVQLARSLGADMVGLNPLHAIFLDSPEDASPYSPSDRTLLNVLYIDVEAVPGFASSQKVQALVASQEFQRSLEAVRKAALVQYKSVADLKLKVLRLLFHAYEEQKDSEQTEAFAAFHNERRALLDRACTFQAMREFFTSQEPAISDCAQWPEEYRSSHSPAIESFAKEHAELIRFHLWLQWIADAQLKAAAAAADGMAVGLYRDLAVGAHPSGAELWSHPDELVSGAQIGAPPDALGPSGQNWGLPPLHPIAAREHAYASFITLLRANMRYAGGLRIDHAMALQRLYWVPKGNDALHGAYVHYAIEDLIGILALESQRHRCLVVGEDLGTVPEGFRERMAEANILSYRVLFFERKKKQFLRPQQYPHLALGVASNHDLATLRGWWQGSDIDLKERLGLFPEGPASARTEREEDRHALLALFQEEGLLQESGEVQGEQFSRAAHAFLARSNALLTLVELDDVMEEEVQVNVPGTSSENPNWRRRPSLTLEELAKDPRLQNIAALMADQRQAASNT